MPTTKRLTIENVDFDDPQEMESLIDQMFTIGLEKVRAEGDEPRRKGILDSAGNVILKELPDDMAEGADRDFGG